MSLEIRPPVAIRITRPYATEDDFLEHELETLSRTSVTLLGAQARPQGVVLRFELVLPSGPVLLRGEGRVVAFREDAYLGLSGLTLRFTRLDSRSKALVDKAATLRDRRRPSVGPAQPPPPEPSEPAASAPVIHDADIPVATAPAPVPAVALPLPMPATILFPPPFATRAQHPPAIATAGAGAAFPPAPFPPALADAPSRRAEPLPARDALLDRLRARARGLDQSAVERILARKGASPQ
jgi:hypothetical protein